MWKLGIAIGFWGMGFDALKLGFIENKTIENENGINV